MSSSGTNPRGRDLRLDFLRGLAIGFILYDHVLAFSLTRIPVWLQLTPMFWGFACASAIFIFISGRVYGIVYGGLLDQRGVGTVVRRSWRRAGQLYLADLVTFVVAWWLLHAERAAGVPEAAIASDILETERAVGIWSTLLGFARFSPEVDPVGFTGILPVYMVLLLAAPLMLWGLSRQPWITLAASAGLYAAAQNGLAIPYRRLGVAELFLNPVGWQLLFLLGMASHRFAVKVPRNRTLGVLAWSAIGLVAVRIWLAPNLAARGVWPAGPWTEWRSEWAVEARTNLPPMRLVYFAVLAYAGVVFMPTGRWFWESRAVRWIVRTGRHSLLAFCVGGVCVSASLPLISTSRFGWRGALLAIAAGVAITLAITAWAERWRKARAAPIVGASPRTATVVSS